MSFVIYFFTIISGTTVIIDTVPVNTREYCMEIVNMINSQPSQGGRRVKAACYISKKGQNETS